MPFAAQWFTTIVVEVMALQVPPGMSSFSVEPGPCSSGAESCPGAKHSSFYGGWVSQESKETALLRYRVIAETAIDVAEHLGCKTLFNEEIPDCVPLKGAEGMGFITLVAMQIGAAIPESGLREDVLMGRGRSGKPDDVGGEGRGPGNEACLMQIHPRLYAHSEELLGYEGLYRCFEVGTEALVRGLRHCSGMKLTGVPWDYRMFSIYGTGRACASSNTIKITRPNGTFYWFSKTEYKLNTFRNVRNMIADRVKRFR